MIENTDSGHAKWWTGKDWTSDPHAPLHFDTISEATVYLSTQHHMFIADTDIQITEHIFMSPISVPEKLN